MSLTSIRHDGESVAVLDLGEVPDDVAHGHGAQRCAVGEWDGSVGHATRQVDGQLGAAEHVQRGWPLWQQVLWGHSPDEGPLARLAHAKVAGVQDAEADLRSMIDVRH